MPIENIVIENPNTITPIKLPNPANGTPNAIQRNTSKNKLKIEIMLIDRPKTETHAKGCAL